jgi:hypothetical protein
MEFREEVRGALASDLDRNGVRMRTRPVSVAIQRRTPAAFGVEGKRPDDGGFRFTRIRGGVRAVEEGQREFESLDFVFVLDEETFESGAVACHESPLVWG